MSHFHYRRANTADIPAMSAIRASVRENALRNPAAITQQMYEDYRDRLGCGWVAELDGRIVGFSYADRQDHSIWALFIHPDFEGRGVGSAKEDLSAMPQTVKDTMGHAIFIAQLGGKPIGDVKQLKGFGNGVIQVSEDDDFSTYRAVYTVHFVDVVYVLHCFQKKSKEGSKTPREELHVIEQRLKRVNEIEQAKAKAMKKTAKGTSVKK